MADTFNVTGTFDKSSYNPGDKITLTLAGNATKVAAQALAGSIALQAADGSTSTLTFPTGATVNVTTTETVKATGVTDTENASRVWSIDSTGLILTATA